MFVVPFIKRTKKSRTDIGASLTYNSSSPEHAPWVGTFTQTHLCLISNRDFGADVSLLRRETGLKKYFSSGSLSLCLNKEESQKKAKIAYPHVQERQALMLYRQQMLQRLKIFHK